MEVDYKDFQAMVHQAVWKKVKGCGADLEETLSAGHMAFVEARDTWDPGKGAFSTHLWNKLRKHLKRVPKAHRPSALFLEDVLDQPSEKGGGFFAAQMSGLSKEAKFVVDLVFTAGEELVDMTAARVRTSRTSIRQYLMADGWSVRAINRVFKEIREAL
jgi:hypothetical protein